MKNLKSLFLVAVLILYTGSQTSAVVVPKVNSVETMFQQLECLTAGMMNQDSLLVDIKIRVEVEKVTGDMLKLNVFTDTVWDSSMNIIALQFDIWSKDSGLVNGKELKILDVESYNNLGFFYNDYVNMQTGQARVGAVTYYPVTTGAKKGKLLFTMTVKTEGTRISFDPFLVNATFVGVDPNPVEVGSFGMMVVEEPTGRVELKYNLSQNYPNPFNPTTIINFSLDKPGHVKLSVYNVLGEEVKNIVDGLRTAGNHRVTFDASNSPSGIYFYRLESEGQTVTKSMILQK